MSSSETPYNEKNILITSHQIKNILKTYDVREDPRDINLYRKAFINKSYCTRKNENFLNGNTNCPVNCIPLQEESNERLEFLGDAILNTVIAAYLFERYPDENEGFLTRMRTKLVNGKMLAHLNQKVQLEPYILISKQIEENNGRKNSNILEDAFEAFIAAVFIDLGFECAKQWILGVVEMHLDFAALVQQNNNYKDMLLKNYQQNFNCVPRFFEVNVETNHSNQKIYTICIKDDNNNILGVGKGLSKKEAENVAAKNALFIEK